MSASLEVKWNVEQHCVQQYGQSAAAKDKDKKKNFSWSRRFPFMKSKDQSGSEDVSADERKCSNV